MQNRISKIIKSKEVKQIIITLFLRVLGVLTLFGFTLFLTNNYSATIVGEYEIIRVFLLIIGSVIVVGTEHSILYIVGRLTAYNQLENRIGKIYFNIVKIIFFSSIIIIFFFFLIPRNIIIDFYNQDYIMYNYIQKAVLFSFFYSLTIFNTEMLRALNYINLSELFRNFFKFSIIILGSIVLLYLGNPLWIIDCYIYGFVLLSMITTLLIVIDIKRKNSVIIEKENHIGEEFTVYSILKKSYPMGISGLCFFIMLSVDVFLLKKYFGSQTVAYYSIAVKLLTILSMVIVAININIAPKVSELYHSNERIKLKELLKRSQKIICIINIPIGLFLILFGKKILLIFGQNYVDAYYSMVILVIGQMIASLFGSTAITLNMIGQQQKFKFIILSATLVNICLNIVLTPKYGMIGGAISFTISLLFWNSVSFYFFLKKQKISNI
ncbi:MATE family efflux transporter [Empedobacter brevis]|uniref:MATE family efflux transporter n=1 Tax=Empedobacter brevis TaxID=247 RepID=UPI0028989FCF|nr:polysaccharide biosynthesis C-terminal domain-containing protein [Empedobacter brevis]